MGNKAKVLGLMSGSSLDGLDACICEFGHENGAWSFEIQNALTIPFPNELEEKLRVTNELAAGQLKLLNEELGEWVGLQVREFATEFDLIGFHGHTTVHDPSNKVSVQIGKAQKVADLSGKPVIANFRMADILLGGQGAPLVPMGEKCLFEEFDGFLNLGGICNASFRKGQDWIAGDIGPFNQVLNSYSRKLGREFDEGGVLSSSGNTESHLLKMWRSIDFFDLPFPKSLSNNWVSNNFLGLNNDPKNVLRSFVEFITDHIANQINHYGPKSVLVTGGGAFNVHALRELSRKTKAEIVVPSDEIISFKEALIFAFLGLLRFKGLPNVLSSCTGALEDSSSGNIYLPKESI